MHQDVIIMWSKGILFSIFKTHTSRYIWWIRIWDLYILQHRAEHFFFFLRHCKNKRRQLIFPIRKYLGWWSRRIPISTRSSRLWRLSFDFLSIFKIVPMKFLQIFFQYAWHQDCIVKCDALNKTTKRNTSFLITYAKIHNLHRTNNKILTTKRWLFKQSNYNNVILVIPRICIYKYTVFLSHTGIAPCNQRK